MDITYLIILTLVLVIISIALMFKNDSLKTLFASFIILVISGTIVTTAG